ncbi:hypothetical protein DFJ74DRAFT_291519 [Hyaloraphidium curvatum]|nr:hypothetical protein DFJ74DRAFT_291519 [Hyaloraphidium curvatum]
MAPTSATPSLPTAPVAADAAVSQEGQKKYIATYLNDQKNATVMPFFEAEENIASRKVDPRIVADLTHLKEEGYVILRNVLDKDTVRKIKEAVHAMQNQRFGRNGFEGTKTIRIMGLPGKHVIFDQLVEHPRVMELLDHILLPNFLLLFCQTIEVHPGEKRQPIHHDDGFIRVPMPHQAFTCATLWAIDEFTEENGATYLYPRSHKWDPERLPDPDSGYVRALMNPGDVIVYLGTVWHGAGPNLTSDQPRMCITAQYCEPYIRTNENYFMTVNPLDVLKMSPRMRSLLGYSIHSPNIGNWDSVFPTKAIDPVNGGFKWFKREGAEEDKAKL